MSSQSTVVTMIESSIGTKGLRFGVIDYVVLTVMILISASIGIYFGFFSKAKNTTEEYLRGGKKMQTWPIAISLVASQLSAISIMSVPAENYTFGLNYIFLVISMAVVVPILIYIIVPVFYENNVSNCYEYLEMRFDKKTRQLITATFVLNCFLLLPILMFVPSMAFSQVSGLNIHFINAIVSSVCITYTMLGGIKAVVWTDVIQGGIMIFSVVMVGILGTHRTGGLSQVLENATKGGRINFDFRLDPRIRLSVWSGFFSGCLMWAGHIGLNQSCVQRIVSLPSYQHIKKALIIAGVGIIVVMGFNCFTGIIMFARYFGCDPMLAGLVSKPDKMMPFFIQDIMGHIWGMPGVFISCVFSAALSTLSATLNSLAGVIYFDYIKPRIQHTEAKANNAMKTIVVLMGLYCIIGGLVVENFNSIIQLSITLTGTMGGAVVGVFLLGMFVPRANSKVAFSGILFSVMIMFSIVVKSQLNMRAGLIKYDILPNSLDLCESRNVTTILNFLNESNVTPVPPTITTTNTGVTGSFHSNREFSIFDVSFFWYKMIGVFAVFAWALPMSYVWTLDKNIKQNPKLFSPIVRKYLKGTSGAGVAVEEMEQIPLHANTPTDNQ